MRLKLQGKMALAAIVGVVIVGGSALATEGVWRNRGGYRVMPDYRRYGVPLGEVNRLYGDHAWEIVPGFRQKDGHMGTYKVGDTISMTISVGPIGMQTYARSKHFGRGSSPMPVIEVLEGGKLEGKILRTFKFQAGAC